MKIFLFFLSGIIFISCQTTIEFPIETKANPCEDVRYMKLKKMNVREMTQSELEYLEKKEKECKKFRAESKKEADRNLIYILSGLGVLLIIGLLLSNSKWH